MASLVVQEEEQKWGGQTLAEEEEKELAASWIDKNEDKESLDGDSMFQLSEKKKRGPETATGGEIRPSKGAIIEDEGIDLNLWRLESGVIKTEEKSGAKTH